MTGQVMVNPGTGGVGVPAAAATPSPAAVVKVAPPPTAAGATAAGGGGAAEGGVSAAGTEKQQYTTKKMARFYFGGVAGSGAACITHPLDLVKVHIPLVILHQLSMPFNLMLQSHYHLTHSERRPQNCYSQEEINLYCIIKLATEICLFSLQSGRLDVLCRQNKIRTFGNPFQSKKLPICT